MDNRSQIDDIKARLDIVTVVQEYVPNLKRSGRNFFGLCPFHQEKTPSFSVNSELGLFKCFGCGKGGDVIRFLEEIEGLEFPKALELAAKKAGVELKREYNYENKKHHQEKQKILFTNNLAAEYYYYVLMEHDTGAPGREYLKKRKLTTEVVKKFKLGYAPINYDNLKKYLNKKGFKEQELVKWGLLVDKNGKIYDKFRNRLLFPILNHQGDVVGFSGRIVEEKELGPKYLNSPETPVYSKSKLLYGLYQGKETIRKKNFAILVEGNIDVLSSHVDGVANIVAPLGTAITIDQLQLLHRYCDKVYLAFDNDEAGHKALIRAIELAQQVNLKVSALNLGKFKDVDDLINSGADWKKVIASNKEVIPHLMHVLKNRFDMAKASEKTEYVKQMLLYIAKITDNIMILEYVKTLGEFVSIEENILLTELKKVLKKGAMATSELVFQGTERAASEEKYLLALFASNTSLANVAGLLKPTLEIIYEGDYALVLKALFDKSLLEEFTENERELYEEVNLMAADIFEDFPGFDKEYQSVVKRLKTKRIKKEINQLKFQARKNPDDQSVQKRLNTLSKALGENL
ncbi:MAG TPA: DNA primase [Candidatus Dojkabacteria bacterium]|nr:DNA primase [Candidatus Dojkabacteria bacterium]